MCCGCLNYTPGQTVTFYEEVKDGYDQRTDDGYTPVVTRIIVPGFTLAAGYPQNMTRIDVGLYYFQFQLPSGAAAVGTYFIDIIYMNPDTGLLVNGSKCVLVNAPFGNFGSGPGGPGYYLPPTPPPCPPFPEPPSPPPCPPYPPFPPFPFPRGGCR